MPSMTGLMGRLVSAMTGVQSPNAIIRPSLAAVADSNEENPQALYATLRALYHNNSMYVDAMRMAQDFGIRAPEAIQGLRNPTRAVCEFYVATVFPGTLPDALPIEMPEETNELSRERLVAAIQQIWQWSNWGAKKQQFARGLPMLGDQLIKAVLERDQAGDPRRAYMQLIPPDYMTDLDTDERGFLTYIRLDIPRKRRLFNGETERYLYTEVWDKESGRYRQWEHKQFTAAVDDLGALGQPMVDEDMARFGVDFVPFVHAKFLEDDASPRGIAAVVPALDKIIYGDMLVTALHQRLTNHNRPDMMLVGVGVDGDGAPLPPPTIDAAATLEINGVAWWSFPAGWRAESQVPQLDYAAHLEVVEAHYQALKRHDLPELSWYDAIENANASGRALHYQLTPARAKAEEVRGSAEDALIRAHQMVLTVGQNAGLKGFAADDIGTYQAGGFEHWFTPRDIVPASVDEEMDISLKRAQTGKTWTDSGASLRGAAQAAGVDDEDVETLVAVDVDIIGGQEEPA